MVRRRRLSVYCDKSPPLLASSGFWHDLLTKCGVDTPRSIMLNLQVRPFFYAQNGTNRLRAYEYTTDSCIYQPCMGPLRAL